MRRTAVPLVLLAVILLLGFQTGQAQDQCGFVTQIAFPVDRTVFQLVQDFGVPSPRHQGRYHTGEDYYGGRGVSFGLPVYAIAAGRVTYSAPDGWGRDGGVIIIEHTFPDGSIYYSQYGHVRQTETVLFPERYTCVMPGQRIATIGDARPAPHLHFEIRSTGPDVPGPGYTWEDPTTVGYLQPSQFILNWQTWLTPVHRWHWLTPNGTRPASPPFLLPDNSLIVLEGSRVRRLTSDGRVLWRTNLERPPLALTGLDGRALLTFASGAMQIINADGTLAERWETGAALETIVLQSAGWLVARTIDGALVAFTPDRRGLAWRIDSIPPILRAHAAAKVLAFVTDTFAIISVSPDGRRLDAAQAAEPAFMTTAPDGGLLVYAQDSFWNIDSTGQWSRSPEPVPPGGGPESAFWVDPTTGVRAFWTGGTTRLLQSLDAAGAPHWGGTLPFVEGRGYLTGYGNVLLLLTDHGFVVALRAQDGAICGQTRIYGDSRAHLWHHLGADGVLRIALAGQIIGLDWRALIDPCA